jgi:hypothetical protein
MTVVNQLYNNSQVRRADVSATANYAVLEAFDPPFKPAVPWMEPQYSVIEGQLPPGLEVQPNSGAIQGTPRAAGFFSATLGVADSVSGMTLPAKIVNITVQPALAWSGETQIKAELLVTPGELFFWSCRSTLSPSGGRAPLTFELAAGSVPSGLEVQETECAVFGVANTNASGTQARLLVKDANNATATELALNFTIAPRLTVANAIVLPASPQLVLVNRSQSIPLLRTEHAGTRNLSCFSVSPLPPGLIIDPNQCLLNGTPTLAGNYSIRLGFLNISNGARGVFEPAVEITVNDCESCIAEQAQWKRALVFGLPLGLGAPFSLFVFFVFCKRERDVNRVVGVAPNRV